MNQPALRLSLRVDDAAGLRHQQSFDPLQLPEILTVGPARLRPGIAQRPSGLFGTWRVYVTNHGHRPVAVALALELQLEDAADAGLFWPAHGYALDPGTVCAEDDWAAVAAVTAAGGRAIPDIPRLRDRGDGIKRLVAPVAHGAWPEVWLHLPAEGQGIGLRAHGRDLEHGLRVERAGGRLSLAAEVPVLREARYTQQHDNGSTEDRPRWLAPGQSLTLGVEVLRCAAPTRTDLMAGTAREAFAGITGMRHPPLMPLSAAAAAITGKYQRENWNDQDGYWSIFLHRGGRIGWSSGWTGGGQATQAFLQDPDPEIRARAIRERTFIATQGLSPSGWFWSTWDGGAGGSEAAGHLVRRSTDLLLFGLRQVRLLRLRGEAVDPAFTQALARAAEALAIAVMRPGGPGQYVDPQTGRTTVAGSTASAIGIAALAEAAREFARPELLAAAMFLADQLLPELAAGRSCGGPTDALQADDCESAYGLLEGYLTLWEQTGEAAWLAAAKRAAALVASWVVNTPWPFAPGSALDAIAADTRGCFIANLRNQHNAPGICTYSGHALLRLARATGDWFHAELLRLTITALPQFLSTPGRPIACLPDADGRPADLPPGWMNESVLVADLNGAAATGTPWYGSCWSEVCLLLAWAEVPSVYWCPSAGRLLVFDHLLAEVQGDCLVITNPTPFPAVVTVDIDADPQAIRTDWWRGAWRTLDLAPGATVQVPGRG